MGVGGRSGGWGLAWGRPSLNMKRSRENCHGYSTVLGGIRVTLLVCIVLQPLRSPDWRRGLGLGWG